jgi:hypothetical protein
MWYLYSVHPVAMNPLRNPPVDSSAFRRLAPRVQLSEDPDTATMQTVQEMCRQINQAANDPLVQACARRAVAQFMGGPYWWFDAAWGRVEKMKADSCFWWCKHYLKFRHHSGMFEAWSADLGDPQTKLQLLISPDVLVRMNRMEGDCAIYTMMLCTMLKALGVRYEICPAAVDHSQPQIFSHVFARCVLPDGTRETLDASHGPYPGWQVPPEDLLRLWVFDEGGRRVNEPSGRFRGLHAYRRRGMGYYDESGTWIEEGPGSPPVGGTLPDPYYNPTQVFGPGIGTPPPIDWGVPYDPGSGGYSAPSQSSAQWATFASNLAKMGFTLAQINAIQPGTVVSANGAILRQNPGYSVPAGGTASFNLGSSSSILYIGLILGGLFLAGSLFKGGR